jgi:Flp pilus assembly CpaE family ATPase
VLEATVVLGLGVQAEGEEIVHFLDRLPAVRVVGAASDRSTLEREVRRTRPDTVVASPDLLSADLEARSLLAVAGRETTAGLRAAIRAGAAGFFLWPEERDSLARAVERTARNDDAGERPSGSAIALYGPRGGSGVTFLATNLAAAYAAGGASTVLVDLDIDFADVTVALGIVPNGQPTLADLGPVLDELEPEHVDRVLVEHPRGFRVLLAPHRVLAPEALQGHQVSTLVRLLRARFDVSLLHLPRALGQVTRAGVSSSDRVLMPVTLDVLAFRDARRALEALADLDLDGRVRLVVNRAVRSEVVPEDAERVFGVRPTAVIGTDRSVVRAQNRGELLVGRSGRTARRVSTLARALLEEIAR